MRITNNMITGNTKNNINSNKVLVDHYNTQMTTQKKIAKASDDPVIAIRSLRLSTNLSHLNQYVDNNIPDAESWLDVTHTALKNMLSLVTDIRTKCVNGATDTLTTDDRRTILQDLESLSKQVYTEGNADYAGRTIFTGYRTSSNLTFNEDEKETTYQITQELSYDAIKEQRYYSGDAEVPADATAQSTVEISESTYDRLRLAYSELEDVSALSYTTVADDGTKTTTTLTPTIYKDEKEWEDATGKKEIGDNDVIFIQSSGELIFGKELASTIKSDRATVSIDYEKTGFKAGELRPEYYYDCKDVTDPANVKTYVKEDQPIDYSIAASTTLTVNTQASDVFDSSIQRDAEEMINVVRDAINAQDKVDRIKTMMKEAKYADETSQANLQSYLDAAQKELDYADDHLQKTFSQYITNFDNYMTSINEAITNVGSMQTRLAMTQTRVENQQETIKELKSANEDREISDIIIDYYASYNAYQASLTAASKVGEQTLLNYL